MEVDSRPYPTIRADFIGKELGADRFTKDGVTTIPPAARWRNNLSALSQYENLFFIASGHVICVYQPEFPYRTLHRKPCLMIIPDMANPEARGYISHGAGGEEGHCSNHMIVGDLGSQEILLLATDSGNVAAYYVNSIVSAIDRAADNPSISPTSDAFELRPFFSHWVYQSAWGLDIHKAGRMIAVSTNTPNEFQVGQTEDDYAKIVVFAFALVEKEEDCESDEMNLSHEEWKPWRADHFTGLPRRDESYIITLKGTSGHDFNIPNIQFVTRMDPDGGIWLISTDIDGSMKMWQVWKANCVRSWDFQSNETLVRPWLRREFPGWSVAALDPKHFRYTSSKVEFAGREVPPYHGYIGRGESFDLSSTRNRVLGNNLYHPLHEDRRDGIYPTFKRQVIHRFVPPNTDDSFPATCQISTDEQMPDVPTNTPFMSALSESRSPEQPPQYTGIIEYDADSPNVTLEPQSDAESDGPLENHPPPPPARSARRVRRMATPILDPTVAIPEFALLHCSNTHLRLLGSPKQETPHIFCQNVLSQHMPENRITTRRGLEFLHMERLNMLHTLGELGAILIATQTGRVAICALTKLSDALLGLRIDAIIPTSTQEHQGHRPALCPLIGMAVAPMRTFLDNESAEPFDFDDSTQDGTPTTFETKQVSLSNPVTAEERKLWARQSRVPPSPRYDSTSWEEVTDKLRVKPKRYVVMLTYADLTVLTYEIWRSDEAQA